MKTRPPIPGMLFHTLHRAHRNQIQAELSQRGLDDLGSPMILFLLRRRGNNGPLMAQREIAEALHISTATVANALKSLERGGYVDRREDLSDQRCKRIALTDKGDRAVEDCMAAMRKIDEQMFAGFTAEEQEQLSAYLFRMLDNLMGTGPTADDTERKECPC